MKQHLLHLGFRPFFLLAALFSTAAIGVWVISYSGYLQLPSTLDPVTWHAHEMIFGFSLAVLMGFLLTASQNWSGVRGVHGRKLFALILIWVLGRIFIFIGGANVYDLITIPALIWFLIPTLWIKEKPRNKKILFMLLALYISDLIIHFYDPLLGRTMAVDTLVGFVLLISGRVIPFFRAKALQVPSVGSLKWLEVSTGVCFVAFVLSSLVDIQLVRPLLAALMFVLQCVRWSRWHPLSAFKKPILAVLYMGYLWLIIGYLSTALNPFLKLLPALSTHYFTMGALGIVMFGMMTRVSLGHTGRPLKASSLMVFSYVLLNIAVIVRSFLPIFVPGFYLTLLQTSGVLWCLSFLLFFIEYYKILTGPNLQK